LAGSLLLASELKMTKVREPKEKGFKKIGTAELNVDQLNSLSEMFLFL